MKSGLTERFAAWKTAALSVALLAVFFFVFIACPAKAMNTDYLNEFKWQNNENVTLEKVYATAAGTAQSGVLGYYVDADMCVYIYYLPDAPSADNYENAKIIYTFHINGEDYQITVGADGAEEMPDGFEKLFSVKQNYTDTPSSPFLCAVQYLGKQESFSVDIYFYNNYTYKLKSSIKYEPPVTEKSTSATKSKNSTTKRKETTTASRSTRKSSSSKATTKYTPQGIPNEEEAFYEENAEEIVESYTDSPVPKSRMSTAAKALLICAAVFGITGLSLVAAAAIKKSEPSSENENSDKEDVITS